MEMLLDYGVSVLEAAGAAAVALLFSRLLSDKLKKYVDLVISLSLLAALLLPLFQKAEWAFPAESAAPVFLSSGMTEESREGAMGVLTEQKKTAERIVARELENRLQLPEGSVACSLVLKPQSGGYAPVLLTVFWQGEEAPAALAETGATICGCPCQVEVMGCLDS